MGTGVAFQIWSPDISDLPLSQQEFCVVVVGMLQALKGSQALDTSGQAFVR